MVTAAKVGAPPLRGRDELDAASADLARFGYCILERALSAWQLQAAEPPIVTPFFAGVPRYIPGQ